MFPRLTTGYEERDGTIGPRFLNFYTRLAEGVVGYIAVGDCACDRPSNINHAIESSYDAANSVK